MERSLRRCENGVGCKHRKTQTHLGDKRVVSGIPIDTYLTRRRLNWYGHVRIIGEQQVFSKTVQRERPRGRPRSRSMPLYGYHQEEYESESKWRRRVFRIGGTGVKRFNRLSVGGMAC